jgi:glycine/D-amino acid oxidase-like deaminating enzyme
VARYGIACDLKHGHLHAAMKPSHMNELRAFEAEPAPRHGRPGATARPRARAPAKPAVHRRAEEPRNLHLHPLNLCLGEARAAHSLGALIFENSEVLDIIHGPRPAVVTAHGRIERAR